MTADGDNFEWTDPQSRAEAGLRLLRLAETRRLMALYEAADSCLDRRPAGFLPIMDRLVHIAGEVIAKARA